MLTNLKTSPRTLKDKEKDGPSVGSRETVRF